MLVPVQKPFLENKSNVHCTKLIFTVHPKLKTAALKVCLLQESSKLVILNCWLYLYRNKNACDDLFLYSFMYMQVKLFKSYNKSRWHIKIVKCLLRCAHLALDGSIFFAESVWMWPSYACTVVIHWLLSQRALSDFMFIVNSGLSDPTCLFDSHVFCFVLFPHVENKPLVISPCKVCNKMSEEKNQQRNTFAWWVIV